MKEPSIAHRLHEKLVERKEGVVIAESCTGGSVVAALTKFPGASTYLLGGLVVYSNEMKMRFLGVSQETLRLFGAVSAPVVTEMVEGIFARTTATWGVALSGIAGPDGGTKEKPVGTIYLAIGKRGEKIESQLIPIPLHQSRLTNIELATTYTLETLLHKL